MRVEQQVMALAELDRSQLRQQWQEVTGHAAPSVSPKLLRLALAYRLQAAALGDLSGTAKRELAQIAKGKLSQPLCSGMRLVREWHGTTHVVSIDEKGRVTSDGRAVRARGHRRAHPG